MISLEKNQSQSMLGGKVNVDKEVKKCFSESFSPPFRIIVVFCLFSCMFGYMFSEYNIVIILVLYITAYPMYYSLFHAEDRITVMDNIVKVRKGLMFYSYKLSDIDSVAVFNKEYIIRAGKDTISFKRRTFRKDWFFDCFKERINMEVGYEKV